MENCFIMLKKLHILLQGWFPGLWHIGRVPWWTQHQCHREPEIEKCESDSILSIATKKGGRGHLTIGQHRSVPTTPSSIWICQANENYQQEW